jgi:hypothetical protein
MVVMIEQAIKTSLERMSGMAVYPLLLPDSEQSGITFQRISDPEIETGMVRTGLIAGRFQISMYKVDDYTSLVQLDKAIWSLWKSIVHGELEGYPVLSSIMGIGSSVLGGVSGGAAASSGTAISDYGSNFQFNAKGGVYSSSDLSAYSGQVVDNPTFFAFAKGAGVMGEAGPEAIMPLTRAADGSLAVRAVSGAGTGGDAAPRVYITIDGNGNTSTQAPSGLEKFGADVGRFVDQRYKQNVLRDIRPGGDIWNAMKGTR